jgi:hypothetical protein
VKATIAVPVTNLRPDLEFLGYKNKISIANVINQITCNLVKIGWPSYHDVLNVKESALLYLIVHEYQGITQFVKS